MSSVYKKNLAVFDLDGTLIQGDSFQNLIKKTILTKPKILFFVLQRILFKIDRSVFAEKIHFELVKHLACKKNLNSINLKLKKKIIPERCSKVEYYRNNGVIVVLLSASPNEYVSSFAKNLSMDYGFGSTWRNDKYFHFYGQNKLDFLNETFPREKWNRVYAMSDSSSDLKMLKTFHAFELVNKK